MTSKGGSGPAAIGPVGKAGTGGGAQLAETGGATGLGLAAFVAAFLAGAFLGAFFGAAFFAAFFGAVFFFVAFWGAAFLGAAFLGAAFFLAVLAAFFLVGMGLSGLCWRVAKYSAGGHTHRGCFHGIFSR
jgi:hypothetical protein